MEDIDKLFNKTKMNLMMSKGSGFLAPLLCKLTFSWDTSIPTAATDGIRLLWNPDFFLSLNETTRVTVLAHELWHPAYLHMIRLEGRDPDIWNQAGDHVINLKLKDDGYDMTGFPYLMDPKFKGMSTNEVYDILMKNPPPPMSGGIGADIIQAPAGDDGHSVKQTIIGNVLAASAVAGVSGSKPGDMPGEIVDQLDKFLNPKLPWETILYQFFNELVQEEYSYARPSRRYSDPIMPGNSGRNGLEHLVYFLDTSGSISNDQVLRFNSEVKFIQEQLQPERLTLVQFDTKIRDIREFNRDDPFDAIRVVGRGGTNLTHVWEYVKQEEPTAVIIFTDLWVDIPKEKFPQPLIWVCMDNARATVPFGKLLHIDD